MKATDDVERLDKEKHSRYRTGVGMLLYLVKHSRPDIANAVRELSKCLDAPTMMAYKEMQRVAKYVIETPNKGLKFQPDFDLLDEEMQWVLILFTDSDWAGDKESRKSVGGYMLFVNGVLLMWKSKQLPVVTLSSSESEYYACSEGVREIPFLIQLLMFLGIKVKLPVKVWVDNVGAIFMNENSSNSQRTRHVDVRVRFTESLQQQGLIDIAFCPSAKNLSDGQTKNVSAEIQEKHEVEYLADREYANVCFADMMGPQMWN